MKLESSLAWCVWILSQSLNTSSAENILNYFVFGVRYSGVKYVEQVLHQSLPQHVISDCSLNTLNNDTLAWKYEPFSKKELESFLPPSCKLEQTLFVMVVKEPFAWLTSVLRRRYHKSANNLLRIHMKALLQSPYSELRTLMEPQPSKKRYRSIMSKRSVTLNRHYSTLAKLPNFAIVRYVFLSSFCICLN